MRALALSSVVFLSALLLISHAHATDVAEALPLTERWIMVHVDDGHVVHHGKGQKRSEEKAVVTPLDAARADKPATWTISSADDAAYNKEAKAPARVGRKSKGTDFAWMCEKWENGRAVNINPDHAKEHWIYLELPSPLKRGMTYTIACGDLIPAAFKLAFKFDEKSTRSEAVHVNLIGYPVDAPKFGYVYQWMGDADCLEVKALVGKSFDVVDPATGKTVFSGKVAFRAPKTQAETQHAGDTPPHGNFIKADVVECDFSALTQAGKYVLSVEGAGCSYPFVVGADVYREAFVTTARGLYHNRSGIELKEPHTKYVRPAPHNTKLTPGFAGKLAYTRSRFIDWTNHDHNAADKPAIEAGIAGPLDVSGWYQDAGDWDSYDSHLNVASVLMLAWELAPANFKDGELNIPESGNGIPDILDEAAWLPRFCYRLRAELQQKKYGSGGIGLRICGDHFGGDGDGVPSYLDVQRQWIASGEDPLSTYRYSAVAAQLAWCLKKAGAADPEKIDWAKEALESYRWADANTKPDDEKKFAGPLREWRAYAAAALFRLTGEAAYQERLAKETAWIKPDTLVWDNAHWGPWLQVLGGGTGTYDKELVASLRSAVLKTCDHAAIETPSKRALRWGGNWSFPMLVGHQTTPWILEGMVGHALTKESEPARAKAYRGAVVTTCDYFLGTNALNMTWVTGLGVRHPNHVFHIDAWYNGKATPHPGIVPYGPWKKDKDLGAGPWDNAWPNQTLHPKIDEWPGNERWFDNRCSPLSGEFTIHQNTCFAAATFGWLCAPGK